MVVSVLETPGSKVRPSRRTVTTCGLDASSDVWSTVPTVLGDTSENVPATDSHRWWALGAVFLTILCVGVDSTVLSVALPTLANSLHSVGNSAFQWFSSGYFLVLAAAMLPAGLLGDRYGHKKVFLVSLAVSRSARRRVPSRPPWLSSWSPGYYSDSLAPGSL